MSTPPENYHIHFNRAEYVVIGDGASLNITPPAPLNLHQLRVAIHRAGASLRDVPANIGGQHLPRPEVDQILNWLQTAPPEQRLGMLLDRPGGGKTILLRDVLQCLDMAGLSVLAIKADTLTGIGSQADLADRLGLPAPVESCIESLAVVEPVVVIIDQLDALSLALSRDQTTLDVVLSALARLRYLPNVRLLASCRTFDLHHDPKLRDLSLDHTFKIEPLTEAQISQALQPRGINPTGLLKEHRDLLCLPLHLKLYTDLLATGDAGTENFRNLQQLYAALWRNHIEPHPPEVSLAIYRLVEYMQSHRQTSAPVALLDDLPAAARYLQQIGFIRREGQRWLFAHQTLLDFCYARRFVAQGRSLSQEILAGSQGLFERSQLVQVLAYLRGENIIVYRRELAVLLFADTLRPHLRLLLIHWLAHLLDPTTAEFGPVDNLLRHAEPRFQFLLAVGDNPAWFDHLSRHSLPAWLRSNDELLLGQVIHYLNRAIKAKPNEVLKLLHPYLGQSTLWNERLAFCLNRLENWSNPLALSTLQQLITAGVDDRRIESCLFQLAHSNPAVGSAALRTYLDRRLQQILTEGLSNEIAARLRLGSQLLGQRTTTAKLLKEAVETAPEAVVTHLLPWFVQVAAVLNNPRKGDAESYTSDPIFAWGWEEADHLLEGAEFALHLSHALGKLAQSSPVQFRRVAVELSKVETVAVQRVLVHAYLAHPAEYTADITIYLLTDRRRWDLGEERYDTCRLLGESFPYMTVEQRQQLAQFILDYQPTDERYGQWRGLTQLRFLSSIPADLLPEPVHRRRQELERKFPSFKLQRPRSLQFGFIGPPIDSEALAKMSDAAWLQAIQKYGIERKGHPDFFRDGSQLPGSLAEQTKKQPARFYHLALQFFNEATPVEYCVAIINGLADGEAPAEWLFDLVRRFAPRLSPEVRRPVCWSLEKRAADDVPDDLLDLMTDWALHDDSPSSLISTPTSEGQPASDNLYQFGINTNQGAALRAVCHCALKHQPPQPERTFQLLEQLATDSSPVVRSCVIAELGPLLNVTEERTLAIFMKTVAGQPVLLQTSLVHRFLYWTYYRHFPTTRPLIERLLHNNDSLTQQAGARLVCLAALRYLVATELEQQIVEGEAPCRRGAAEIYARNLEKVEIQAVCLARLRHLMHDPDEQVRRYVGDCFQWLLPEQLADLREFVVAFLDSPALLNGVTHLVNYLAKAVERDSTLTLIVVEKILAVTGQDVTSIHSAIAVIEPDLVRLLLAVYHHTSDDPMIQAQAIGLFEQLLHLNSHFAQQALDDYDRR